MRVISKATIKAAAIATGDPLDARYHGRGFINKIHVDPNPTGPVRATNGSLLIEVRETAPHASTDFPEVPGVAWQSVGTIGEGGDPIVIPADVAARIVAGMPKRRVIPILESAAVGRTVSGAIAIASTDLQVPIVVTVDGSQGDQLPAGAQIDRLISDGVIDGAGGDPDRPARTVRLILAAKMLADLAKLADVAGRPKGTNSVTIEIPIEGARVDAKTGQIIGAVKITTGKWDIEIVGAMMPCRQ